ncbi:MAG: hypothetical protein P3W87_001680 [Gammaproteobacteria bacterium]|nr:hypothetical protein [Gammaproteobacteria bacterium]
MFKRLAISMLLKNAFNSLLRQARYGLREDQSLQLIDLQSLSRLGESLCPILRGRFAPHGCSMATIMTCAATRRVKKGQEAFFQHPVSILVLWVLASAAAAEPFPLADPLRPEADVPLANSVVLSPEIGLPRLSMIVRNLHQHYAVIDGYPLRVGEQWAGYRVLAIHPSSVLLEREGGSPVELGLLSGAVIKKPVPNNTVGNRVRLPQGDIRRAESMDGFRNPVEENLRP